MPSLFEVLLHLPLASAAVWFANGLWPLTRGLRTSPERAFVVGSLLLGAWTLLDWVFLHSADLETAVLVSKARITMYTLASLAFLYFGRWLTRPRGPVDALLVLPVAATIAISWTVMTSGAEWVWWGPRLIRDPLWYAVWAVQFGGYVFAALAYIGSALRGAPVAGRGTRAKLAAIFAALVLGLGGWFVTNAYNNLTQTAGFPALSALLLLPGVLVLAFLAPISRKDFRALLRRVTLTPSRPHAAIFFHNSGNPLAQIVLRGSQPIDPLVLQDLSRAVDHVVSVGLRANPGTLRRITHGDLEILFEQGRYLSLAIVSRGKTSEGIRSDLRRAITDFEAAHGDRLAAFEDAAALAEPALDALDEVLNPRSL